MDTSNADRNNLSRTQDAAKEIVARDALDDTMYGGGKLTGGKQLEEKNTRQGSHRNERVQEEAIAIAIHLRGNTGNGDDREGESYRLPGQEAEAAHPLIDPLQSTTTELLFTNQNNTGHPKSAPPERLELPSRTVSDIPRQHNLPKVKTKVRATNAVRTLPDSIKTASPPFQAITEKGKKRRKSSRRKEDPPQTLPLTLPLTEQNLRYLDQGDTLPPGPLFRTRTKVRSRTPGEHRKRKSNKTRPDRSTPRDYAKNTFVKIRVIGEEEYSNPTMPEEDTPVTAAFLKVMKAYHPTWGALAKELSQGIHSVQVPKISFTHPTGRDDVISFGDGTKRAILMGYQHERQIYRMRDFLVSNLDFDDVSVLENPSKAEILSAFRTVTHELTYGDSLVIYYVGHNLDAVLSGEPSSTTNPRILIPADYEMSGFVTELDFWERLVRPIEHLVEITCLLDCHLPKTAFDLVYRIEAQTPHAHSTRRASIVGHQDQMDMLSTLGGMLEIAAGLTDIKTSEYKPQESLPLRQYDLVRQESQRHTLTSLLNTDRHYGAHAAIQLITVPYKDTIGQTQPGESTLAFIKVLTDPELHNITIESLLFHMRMHFNVPIRLPKLTSSRPIDVHEPFTMSSGRGVDRALLIGLNYSKTPTTTVTSDEELEGVHLDLMYFKKFLHKKYGFLDQNCIVLVDDKGSAPPTRQNILAALASLVSLSEPGDSVCLYFICQGGNQNQNETIYPVDAQETGGITGEELWHIFVAPMSEGVQITCLFDAPIVVLELPYSYEADDKQAKVFISTTGHVVGGSHSAINLPYAYQPLVNPGELTCRPESPPRRPNLGNALFQGDNNSARRLVELFSGAWSSLKDETRSNHEHSSSSGLDIFG